MSPTPERKDPRSSEAQEKSNAVTPELDLATVDRENVRQEARKYLDSMTDALGVELSDAQRESATFMISGVLETAADQAKRGYEGGVDPEQRVRKMTLEQIQKMTEDAALKEKLGKMLEKDEETTSEAPGAELPEISLEADDVRIARTFMNTIAKRMPEQAAVLRQIREQAEDPQAWQNEMVDSFVESYEFRQVLKRARELGQDETKAKEQLVKAAEGYLRKLATKEKAA